FLSEPGAESSTSRINLRLCRRHANYALGRFYNGVHLAQSPARSQILQRRLPALSSAANAGSESFKNPRRCNHRCSHLHVGLYHDDLGAAALSSAPETGADLSSSRSHGSSSVSVAPDCSSCSD